MSERDKAKFMAIPWRMHLLIVTVGIIMISIMGYGFYTGYRISAVYAPLVDATMEIKLETTSAHLWFEEIITGDRYEEMEGVWRHLDNADWYAKALLEGGKNLEGTFIPLDDVEMRQKIKKVQEKMVEFRNITRQRLREREISGIGTTVDQRYDAIFKDFVKQADEVETKLQQIMLKDLHNFRNIQTLLIGISVLLFIFIGIAFWRFERRQANNLLMLNSVNEDLKREINKRERVEEELRAFSLTDELTGLYNRRGFFSLTEHLFKIAKRQEQGMFMLYADLDNMKKINDTLGHKEGDNALIDIANILKTSYRESDVVARIGGDEFVVIPVGTTKEHVDIITARLQKQLDIHNAKSNRRYKLSVSIGIAYYDPENPCSIDELLTQADKLMYKYKRRKKES